VVSVISTEMTALAPSAAHGWRGLLTAILRISLSSLPGLIQQSSATFRITKR